jgi:hypothetical protein
MSAAVLAAILHYVHFTALVGGSVSSAGFNLKQLCNNQPCCFPTAAQLPSWHKYVYKLLNLGDCKSFSWMNCQILAMLGIGKSLVFNTFLCSLLCHPRYLRDSRTSQDSVLALQR